MIKISSKDIQAASQLFQNFLKDVVKSYVESDGSCYEPDNKELAKKYGIKYLGAGVYRVAFKYKNLVLKTHLDIDETDNITIEHRVWNYYKNDIMSATLNPVLFCKKFKIKTVDYGYVHIAYSISLYVLPHLKAKPSNKHKQYTRIKTIVSNTIFDGHPGNIGVLNKLPVLIDYQFNSFIPPSKERITKEQYSLIQKQHKALKLLCSKAVA